MGGMPMDARGLGDRGTSNRRAVMPVRPPAEYPPFDVNILGLMGAAAIPNALAYALKWHLELMRAATAWEAKELADNLIATWEFLKEMEVLSPRSVDGALLVRDPLAVWAGARFETELHDLETGETILVTKNRVDSPLPVWQPTLFPPELPPDVKADYRNRIPEFVDVVIPYLVNEVTNRASYKLENWEAFAKEVIESVIKELILDKIRTKIRNYLIKKVGKRIVPGLNAVAALVDLFTGDEEAIRMRNIIACMIVALRSNADEDMHIAAKTCSKVVADEFEQAVMDALISYSQKGAAKLAKKSKAKRDADERAEKAKPVPKVEAPPQPKAEPKGTSVPLDPPSAPATAHRAKPQEVAQPRDMAKQGAPKSIDAPMRNDGAQAATASGKSAGTARPRMVKPEPEVIRIPRRPNKREREMLAKAHEKQRQHDEKIAKRIKELKEAEQKKQEEQQKLAANGGTATANNGTGDKGTSSQSKGNEDRKAESTGTASGDASTSPPTKPPRRSSSSERKQKPFEPEEPTVHVKEPKPVEDTQHVRGEGEERTSSHSAPRTGRAAAEQQGGAMGIGEQAHHGMQTKGAGETGEATREAARTAGVSGNVAENMTPARGISEDSRAIHGSSAAHSSMHGSYDAETLRRQVETRKSDPEGVKRAMADFGADLYEGRRHPTREEFYLGGDPDSPEPETPEPKE